MCIRDRYERGDIRYTMVFKNYGSAAGASVAHPHTQIVGTTVMPAAIERELAAQDEYEATNGRCLLCDLVDSELKAASRVIESTDDFAVFCPYSSRVNLETWIVPRLHQAEFTALSDTTLESLARAVIAAARKFERVGDDLAYNLLLHSSPPPAESAEQRARHCRIEILPRTTGIAGLEFGTGLF